MVKDRVYQIGFNPAKNSALAALHHAFGIVLRLFAPTVPYICEELWSQRYASKSGREKSVHTSSWPEPSELAEAAPPADPASYDTARTILRIVRQTKTGEKRSLRWPVKRIALLLQAT